MRRFDVEMDFTSAKLSYKSLGAYDLQIHLEDGVELSESDIDIFNVKLLNNQVLGNDRLRTVQDSDAQISSLKKSIAQNRDISEEPLLKDFGRHLKYLLTGETLLWYRKSPYPPVSVIPFKALVHLGMVFHKELGHVGKYKLFNLLRERVWHPAITKVASDIATTCEFCQLYKIGHQTIYPPVLKIETRRPFELVAMDCVNFPRSGRGYIGCLVAVDHYSKWSLIQPIKNKKSSTIADVLENQFLPAMTWLPDSILTDNGVEFRAPEFVEVLRRYGIKQLASSPYKPSSNGAVERINRTIGELLKSLVQTGEDWDRSLTKAVMIYNNTIHSQLGMSPADKLLRQSHEKGCHLPLPSVEQSIWKEGHPNFQPFQVGQYVVRKLISNDRTNIRKFQKKYWGPFVVIKVNDNGVTYELEDAGQENDKRWRVHHTHLKVWKHPPQYLQEYGLLMKSLDEGKETPGKPRTRERTAQSPSTTEPSAAEPDRWVLEIEETTRRRRCKRKTKTVGTQTEHVRTVDGFTQCDWFSDDSEFVDFDIFAARLPTNSFGEESWSVCSGDSRKDIDDNDQFPARSESDATEETSHSPNGLREELSVHEVDFPRRKSWNQKLNSSLDLLKKRQAWRQQQRLERFQANRDLIRRPLTRSQGSAEQFPNVQKKIIEYEKRSSLD